MLRMMFAPRRRVVTLGTNHASESSDDSDSSCESNAGLEPWVDFIRRVTHNIDANMHNVSSDDWVTIHRRRTWRFAQRTVALSDQRWTTRLLTWKPAGSRNRGGQLRRWSDCIEQVAGIGWMEAATDAYMGALAEPK